ncbi:MAG: 5-formyltetrahydrofolate cyclo-ligase [Clostridia bacterium]|nr:5-formyltetrahydrofolate cyclo-ligase [Clostridia bacterium]
MDKQHIRNRIKEERSHLSPEFVSEKSQQVYERLIALPQLEQADCVLTYADFSNEIQTGAVTGWLLYHGKKVCLPVIEDHTMYAVRYAGAPLSQGSFGIEEPHFDRQEVVNPAVISVVLCPGVAFSREKARIGFGKGYYDRFLAQAPQAFKIGLAYDFQVLASVESGPHDIPMNMIVTPEFVLS